MAQLVSRGVPATADDPVAGLMQDYPLTVHHIFWRLEHLFGHKEVVTLREDGVHRYTVAQMVRRVYRLANTLRRLGIRPGDRVGRWPGTTIATSSCTTLFHCLARSCTR